MLCDQIGPMLSDYSEDRLSVEQRQHVQGHLEKCADCSAALEQLHALEDFAQRWVDAPVPHWQPHSPFTNVRAPTPWLSWLSMAFSVCAMGLVFLQANFTKDDNGFHLRFGQATTVASTPGIQVKDLEARLALFEQQQQLNLGNQLAAWEIGQQENNQKILKTVMTYSREQQRKDLAQWAEYWQTVRAEDQVSQGTVFNQIIDSQQQSRRELRALKTALNTTQPSSEDL